MWNWLIPSELHMLAYIFERKVEFSTTAGSESLPRIVEIYNQKAETTVGICFNGVNHYSRTINFEENLSSNFAVPIVASAAAKPREAQSSATTFSEATLLFGAGALGAGCDSDIQVTYTHLA